MKNLRLVNAFASHETAPLTIKTKSGLSAEGVAVLHSKTQKPVSRRQPSGVVSVYDCSSVADAPASARLVRGGTLSSKNGEQEGVKTILSPNLGLGEVKRNTHSHDNFLLT